MDARSSCLGTNSGFDLFTQASTAFSRPFTSLSFVSSSANGSSTLTNKIDRMNKATIKMLAKQFI